MSDDLIRLPRLFFDDHCDRLDGEVPLPEPVRESERFVWVRLDDPGMVDLVNDARHYADPDMRGEGGWVDDKWARAAQRLLCAIEEASA